MRNSKRDSGGEGESTALKVMTGRSGWDSSPFSHCLKSTEQVDEHSGIGHFPWPWPGYLLLNLPEAQFPHV